MKSFLASILMMIVLMEPTGEKIDGYPEMQILSDTSALYQNVHGIIDSSAMEEILGLYYLAQVYLKNSGKIDHIEPPYLALTENQGGYAKKGFYLMKDGKLIDHTQTSYVDLLQKTVLQEPDKLMSFTQLYPHELGHVIYGAIARPDTGDAVHRSVDMHYFPVITDYAIAFNEGFAEHLENISRLHEKNETIVKGIQADIEKIAKYSPRLISGFENDLQYPMRLGYFKASMITWFQQYEDFRRYEHALSGIIKYRNASPYFKDPEDRLSFRNAGLVYSDETRNIVQALSTEGLICSFFTRIAQSDLPKRYLPVEFYNSFLEDTSKLDFIPGKQFTPLQNQFMKYYIVMNKYVSKWTASPSQFIDFFEGYIYEFPEEKDEMLTIFQDVTGQEYTNKLPPRIWMMVKEHDHRVIAIDPYGAVTIPVYTFDLNAAEVEDLRTIPGINDEDARLVVDFRKQNGFFESIGQIANIEDLNDDKKNTIINSVFDQDYFESVPNPELSFDAIVYTPLKWLSLKIIIYFVVFMVILHFMTPERNTYSIRKRLWMIIKYFGLWLLIFIAGIVPIIFSFPPLMSFVIFMGIVTGIICTIFRKNQTKFRRSIIMSSLMGFIVILSLL